LFIHHSIRDEQDGVHDNLEEGRGRKVFRPAMFADDPLVFPFVEQGLLILIALIIVTLIS
jgi:hypothetical protein